MQYKILEIKYTIYDTIEALPKEEQQLLKASKEALKSAYAPYSNFLVGAALLLQNGEQVIGNNQENAAYPLTLCAERVAIFSAASRYPTVPIEMIAITAKSPSQILNAPISPCGSCRQVIAESEFRHKNSIKIILQGETGSIYIFKTIQELLPFSFNQNYL